MPSEGLSGPHGSCSYRTGLRPAPTQRKVQDAMAEYATTQSPSSPVRGVVTDERGLLEFFGVDELRIVDAYERTVQLSPGSSLGCPAHGVTLKPDACSSCRFLVGDAA
jgi:hypothetical protein